MWRAVAGAAAADTVGLSDLVGICENAATSTPHEEQKRLSAEIGAEHDGHFSSGVVISVQALS